MPFGFPGKFGSNGNCICEVSTVKVQRVVLSLGPILAPREQWPGCNGCLAQSTQRFRDLADDGQKINAKIVMFFLLST